MADKNDLFTKNLLAALKDKGIDYEPGKKTGLKKFAKDNEIIYTTLHKCLRENMIGHVPEWDQLLKISKAVGKSIDWLLTGKEKSDSNSLCIVNCDLEMMNICKTVKEIRDSDTHWWDSLKQNIDSFKIGLDTDIAQGLASGAPKKPAGSTGLKK